MSEAFLLTFARDALLMAALLAAPALVVSLVIGSLVSLFQATTQISEVTLTFVPKVLGVGLSLLLLGSWMAQQMLAFTAGVFNGLPGLAR